MPQITVISGDKTVNISFDGEKKLSDALICAGLYVEHPCGGAGKCGKCTVTVDGREELSCRYTVTHDITVTLPQKEEILSVSGAEQTGNLGQKLCLCLDIGTTTLALALVSLDKKETVKVLTATNPQRAYGADVISRIDHCRKNGIESLSDALIEGVNALISRLLAQYEISSIEKMYVSGNTTMLHTFFGVDCSSLGVSPYTPVFLDSKNCKANDIGIKKVDIVESLPGISAFVGAEIVAGLKYVDKTAGKYDLLVDLGTNAEIALIGEDKIVCTTAAAGPCFEGANISCGMSAVDGAICKYRSDGTYKTIGNTEPRGLCATGLIDLVAELVKSDVIDESGYMEDEEFSISDNVKLTQKDVRELQLAKSAVRSALECLIDHVGISAEDIGKMYVAGGFSSGINIGNAVDIGLFQKELQNKFTPVNNSSLLGTVKQAIETTDLSQITKKAYYLDISGSALFSELFFENMEF